MKCNISRTTQPIRTQSDRDAVSSYFLHRNLRDYALFMFGIYTGRRISDIVVLNVRDVAYIDFKRKLRIVERLKIQEHKTKKIIDIRFHPMAQKALRIYLKERLKLAPSIGALLNEPLFKSQKSNRDGEFRLLRQSVWNILSKAAHACGLDYNIGTHSLRKTFGYLMYHSNTDIEKIQLLLNHSSPVITLAYIGVTQDDLDEAILSI